MLTSQLLNWYLKNKRDLPWRETKDPYLIWLSEIILQQTRVNQGLPYYLKFKENYPSIYHLAKAKEEEVLRLWQGLGYYSRGRNLLHTAKHIVNELDGNFPDTLKELKKLKGVGDYTAAAIGSIAFKIPEPAIDGNVLRVIARLYKIEEPIDDRKTLKKIKEISELLIAKDQPDLYNQAMMELGATVCTPHNPKCNQCPIREYCLSFPNKDYQRLPVKKNKVKVTNQLINYLVLENTKRKLFLKQRKENDIWKKMFDFPELTKTHINKILKQTKAESIQTFPPVHTTLTHRKIKAVFTKISYHDLPDTNSLEGQWYSYEEIEQLPKPKIIVDFIDQLKASPFSES